MMILKNYTHCNNDTELRFLKSLLLEIHSNVFVCEMRGGLESVLESTAKKKKRSR